MKTIFIILDGLGDRPIKEFGDKTPLEFAKTSNMDFLVEQGICGMMAPLGLGLTPGSGPAHFEIFGYSPYQDFYPNRGVIEALGIGYDLKQEDIALRVNFATIQNKKIIDRRAGRIESAQAFEKDLSFNIKNTKFIFKAGIGHRGALIIKGKNLSSNISDNDNHKTGVVPKKLKAISKNAEFTADVLNQYLKKANEILEKHRENKKRKQKGLALANYLLVRGAGKYKPVISFKEKYGLTSCCVAGGGLYKGVAKFLGMDLINVKGATGKKDTNIKAKFLAAKRNLKNYNFIFLHFKATDLFGHDGDPVGKKNFIEKIDKELKILMKEKCLLSITGDHSTPCALKEHSGDPVPILFSGKTIRKDSNAEFGERVCSKGGLGRIKGNQVMPEILNLTGKQKLIG
ncbi:MAG: 2,3-bisphosphoglycerate-independent phosphoglycerate mutase [Patescibacteria group bacterium]|nr:2,3-bisphosphoglycerate-independent phosphoglycerate mutase [Patescibacteria group bacterium]